MEPNGKTDSSKLGRRGLLGAFATFGGSVVLTSLATGIPAKILLDPLSASAGEPPKGKMLILSSSSQGDPLNANVPGTYEVGPTQIFHSADPAMAKTALSLAGTSTFAAKPWAQLPQPLLDRTAFFHHATYTPVHGELNRVQKMMNATEKNDMLISLIARELAPILGTVQADPVSLGATGGELLSSSGRLLGNVAPLSVRQALGGVDGPLKDLTAMRDTHIDRIYNLYREHGTPSQITLLDAWVRSRDEVRSIGQELIARLDAIDGNDQLNQVRTAAVLAAMNIAPVITIHLDFGRDNHNDTDFETEAEKHLESIPMLELLMTELDALKAEGHLKNDVLVGTLNVFGRTLKKKGMGGRDHHSGHHVMVLMGEGIKGGIVGGVEPNAAGTEYISTSIDSTTGAKGGDIPFEESLGAAGKTLGYALGVPEARLDEMIEGGKVVKSIIA
jgi:uncharacterized protein (DUF1501 family)